MNVAHAGVVAGLLALVAYSVISTPARDEMIVGSVARAPSTEAMERFELRSSSQDGACIIVVSEPAGTDMRQMRLGPGCVALNADLDVAAYWLDRQDGSVAFLDGEGAVTAEFSASDGAAFESYKPAEPMMLMLAVD